MTVVIQQRRGDRRAGAAEAVVGSPAAQDAVVRRKHEAELRHPSAQGRLGFQQERVQPRLGQVDGGAHPSDSAADDQDAVAGGGGRSFPEA
jgi:hypothetical protein